MNNSNRWDFWERERCPSTRPHTHTHTHTHTHRSQRYREEDKWGVCECVQQYVRLNLWYLGWAPLQDFSSLLELETSLKCKYSHPVYPASSPSSTPILFRPSSRPVHRAARPSKQALTVPLTISNQCFMFWPKLCKQMLTRRTPHYSIWYKKCKCRQVDSVRRLKMSSQQNEIADIQCDGGDKRQKWKGECKTTFSWMYKTSVLSRPGDWYSKCEPSVSEFQL